MIKFVKGISIALGVLLVGGLGVLVYGLLYKTQSEKPQQENARAQVPAVPVAPLVEVAEFDAVGLGQPAGSVIAAVTAQGSLVYLTVRDGGLPDRLLVVDLGRHRVVGRIEMGDVDSRPPRPAR